MYTGVDEFTYLARQVHLRKEASDNFHYAAVAMIVGKNLAEKRNLFNNVCTRSNIYS
jgi:hypothetical protein